MAKGMPVTDAQREIISTFREANKPTKFISEVLGLTSFILKSLLKMTSWNRRLRL